MIKNYQIPSVCVSPYLYIGIIKSYDRERKYGYIMVLYRRDVFFHVKNSNIVTPEPNMFVAFRVRKSTVSGRIEAYDVSTLPSCKEELLLHQENLLAGDLKVLYYCCPQLMKENLSKLLKDEIILLSNIDDYVENYEEVEAINSYSVEVVPGHIYKPGGDDVAWVEYVGEREKGKYMIYSLVKGCLKKSVRDVYMDSILPPFREEIFHDRGFCPWEQMLKDFGDLTHYRQEAIKRTVGIRDKARKEYNKQAHKNTIVKFLQDKVKRETLLYQQEIEQSINDSLSYGYSLKCDLSSMRF